MQDFDLVIVGAGPAGLCLARALNDSGLDVALIEQRAEPELADPPFDGREIALTHLAVRRMRALGLWERLASDEPSPIRRARVLNGDSPLAMKLHPDQDRHGALGYLVPNHSIRRAAFACASETPRTTLLASRHVARLSTDDEAAKLVLDDGATLTARLAVAADSRFSETRRAMGIPTAMYDFGRTMLVCRMALERPHAQEAWEWFDYGQTLAVLPLNGALASIVATLPQPEIDALCAMEPDAFGREITRRFDHRLGQMTLESTRHSYPLIATYPERLVARRFACVGDAAVGMHPVTAHGFNFGLDGVITLARTIADARNAGEGLAAPAVLARYERIHRARTRPLYLATNAIARLYSDETPPARVARQALLRAGQLMKPLRDRISASVTSDQEASGALTVLAGQVATAISGRWGTSRTRGGS